MENLNRIPHDPGTQRYGDRKEGWDPEIGSIHYRAQDVEPGGLFVAIQGLSADGHDFVDEALVRGASAIVTQKPVGTPPLNKNHGAPGQRDPIIVEVENTRKALAAMSGRFYGDPSENMVVIGITGTNGKTTTAFFIESILENAGFNVGVFGTLNCRYSGKTMESPMTTPESLDLQRILSDMFNHGVTHVVMEVSSHAIDLFRVDNCCFDVGVFTNLSQDHLDYHGDMDSYWSCKKRFFTQHLNSASQKSRIQAVINCNDAKGPELARVPAITALTTGCAEDHMVRPRQFQCDLSGIAGRIATPAGAFEFESPLIGRHNLENILCATGTGIALDLPLEAIKDGIEAVSGVPGRLERIPNDVDRFVYVDYAHTPDALENVLAALKSMAGGRIICIFGCGGDRDKDKRPRMGEIAGRLSDLTVITSDNPRTEDPVKVIDQITEGTEKVVPRRYLASDLAAGFQKQGYVVEPDRGKAIRLGISVSLPGDTVLIAGKGDEKYQIIGNRRVPFDDRKEAKTALRSCL